MIEIFAAIIGVVVGWALNEITDSLHKKPKLCFRMVSTPTNELTDKEYRTKTSLSESGIEVFNIGEKPVILRIKGGSNATAHVGTIDLEQLREFQMKAYSGQKEDKTFKPTPPDFDYKGAYERRKGTMFECFCAKKKAD